MTSISDWFSPSPCLRREAAKEKMVHIGSKAGGCRTYGRLWASEHDQPDLEYFRTPYGELQPRGPKVLGLPSI